MIKRNIPRFNPSKKIFIIAEIGNNHEGNFNIAKKLIKAAADSGVAPCAAGFSEGPLHQQTSLARCQAEPLMR